MRFEFCLIVRGISSISTSILIQYPNATADYYSLLHIIVSIKRKLRAFIFLNKFDFNLIVCQFLYFSYKSIYDIFNIVYMPDMSFLY